MSSLFGLSSSPTMPDQLPPPYHSAVSVLLHLYCGLFLLSLNLLMSTHLESLLFLVLEQGVEHARQVLYAKLDF